MTSDLPLSITHLDDALQAYCDLPALAVGLSGGADSLALTDLLEQWCKKHNIALTALSVNHGLRADAAKEVELMAQIMRKKNVKHVILQPEQPIGTQRVQERARLARYDLMFKYCHDHDIPALCTAHHLDDQIETFLMRLARGSGLNGLTAMAIESRQNEVTLLRPLLGIPKKNIINYCRLHALDYIEDPSNADLKYDRARLRQAAPVLNDLGLTAENLEHSRRKLAAAQSFIQYEINAFFQRAVIQDPHQTIIKGDDFYTLHPYLQRQVIEQLLKHFGKNDYPPRSESLTRLMTEITAPNFKKTTLHGCLIGRTGKKDLFLRAE